MRSAIRLLAGSMLAMTAVTVVAAGSSRAASTPLKVADFAAMLANHGSTGVLESPEQAAQRLDRLGVPLGDPEATLTEGRLSAIMGFYGLQATTSNPSAIVESTRGTAVAAILGATAGPFAGTEKKKGSPGTGDLGVCLSERNRGKCVNCCKDQGSPANACARFCQAIDHPSPSSPR